MFCLILSSSEPAIILDPKLTAPFTPILNQLLWGWQYKTGSPPIIETSLSFWFCVKARFFQWARKPLPTTRKRNLRRFCRSHEEVQTLKTTWFCCVFVSKKMLDTSSFQPGQPEKVEIFSDESLLRQVGCGSLQPFTHFHLTWEP